MDKETQEGSINVRELCIPSTATIRDAASCINRNRRAYSALVTDDHGRLHDIITDGDIRRAMLDGVRLDDNVAILKQRKSNTMYQTPVTASENATTAELIDLMNKSQVDQLPLVDNDGCMTRFVRRQDLLTAGRRSSLSCEAVIMAGGFGKRLRPFTENIPKPMLPVGEKPLLQHTIEQLRDAGISQVHVTTHFLAKKIKDYFGDGGGMGISIKYVNEDVPLGTAGALGLLGEVKDPLLVINGDILTQLDYAAMLEFHRNQNAVLTIGVRQYDFTVPYGVMECNGPVVRAIKEKPTVSFYVNSGIYLLQPEVVAAIAIGEHCDMTDIIKKLLETGCRVASFPIMEYWVDIGQPFDYLKAVQDMELGKLILSPDDNVRKQVETID